MKNYFKACLAFLLEFQLVFSYTSIKSSYLKKKTVYFLSTYQVEAISSL